MEFGLRPNAEGAGAHASMRGEREREFGGVIAVRSIQDDQEIAVARCQIDVLDLHPDLLGQLLGGFGALGRSLMERIPCSVQLSEHMNIGMRSSIRE